MHQNPGYEIVIGLEVHARLLTKTKLFCGDAIAFGAGPNTLVSAVSLAHPGTLPRTNGKAVEFAVKMGLACNCTVNPTSQFARKNYFYADLPKGYQVSQHSLPVCTGGYVPIHTEGGEKKIRLNRIHLEEDAGKSIHDQDPDHTLLDFNRAGTPLIEIVTEPCIHSADEAYQYLTEIRRLVRWLEICDGNMEEGSLRCDANISLRTPGSSQLGTRVEVKNLNSTRNLRKAIETEVARMTTLLDAGIAVRQETRSFDAATDTTFAMRDKEEANDYRYFPDPDLPPLVLSAARVDAIRESLPPLPAALEKKYILDYGLSAYDATQLTEDRATNQLFELLCSQHGNYKSVANWMIGPLRQWLNDGKGTLADLVANAAGVTALMAMVEAGQLSFSVASVKLLPEVLAGGKDPMQLATESRLIQVSDMAELEKWVDQAIGNLPGEWADYLKGKKALIGLFVGEVKKLSKGQADPKKVNELLQHKLNTQK